MVHFIVHFELHIFVGPCYKQTQEDIQIDTADSKIYMLTGDSFQLWLLIKASEILYVALDGTFLSVG